jgi:purine-cytosine permease-like protein
MIGQYSKSIAAAIFAVQVTAQTIFGHDYIGVTNSDWLIIIGAWLGVVSVFAFPNAQPVAVLTVAPNAQPVAVLTVAPDTVKPVTAGTPVAPTLYP